ncbi:hypothetical protein P9112_012035 [Eukaryota sp. TZLM1-RC]
MVAKDLALLLISPTTTTTIRSYFSNLTPEQYLSYYGIPELLTEGATEALLKRPSPVLPSLASFFNTSTDYRDTLDTGIPSGMTTRGRYLRTIFSKFSLEKRQYSLFATDWTQPQAAC